MNKLQKLGLFLSGLGVSLLATIVKAADFDASDTLIVIDTVKNLIVSPIKTLILWGLTIMAFIFIVSVAVRIIRKRMGGASKIG